MSNSIIPATIDAIQEINRGIAEMVHSPELRQYPATVDTAHCPISLTEPEAITFGGFDDDEATIDYVTRVLFDPIGQNRFGDMKLQIHQLMNDYVCHYMDEDTYQVPGMRVIQTEPVKLVIGGGLDAFTMTGYTLIEYPAGSERWFHGFEVRFSVTSLTWSC